MSPGELLLTHINPPYHRTISLCLIAFSINFIEMAYKFAGPPAHSPGLLSQKGTPETPSPRRVQIYPNISEFCEFCQSPVGGSARRPWWMAPKYKCNNASHGVLYSIGVRAPPYHHSLIPRSFTIQDKSLELLCTNTLNTSNILLTTGFLPDTYGV